MVGYLPYQPQMFFGVIYLEFPKRQKKKKKNWKTPGNFTTKCRHLSMLIRHSGNERLEFFFYPTSIAFMKWEKKKKKK